MDNLLWFRILCLKARRWHPLIRWPLRMAASIIVYATVLENLIFLTWFLLAAKLAGPARRVKSSSGSVTSKLVTLYRTQAFLAGLCADSLSWHFLDFRDRILTFVFVLNSFASWSPPNVSGLRTLAGRCNFGDDLIVSSDASQIVILGAGNDTRLHRLPNLPTAVFEVDSPFTQFLKLKKLTAVKNFAINHNVKYVSVDFEKESWLEKLVEAGFDLEKKTVFVWDGVTYYLTNEAIRSTLIQVSKCAPGTKISFDFAIYAPNAIEKDIENAFKVFRLIGEPWFSIFTDDSLKSLLKDVGMILVTEPIYSKDSALKCASGFALNGTSGTSFFLKSFRFKLCCAEVQ